MAWHLHRWAQLQNLLPISSVSSHYLVADYYLIMLVSLHSHRSNIEKQCNCNLLAIPRVEPRLCPNNNHRTIFEHSDSRLCHAPPRLPPDSDCMARHEHLRVKKGSLQSEYHGQSLSAWKKQMLPSLQEESQPAF